MHHVLPPVQSVQYAQAALATDARSPRRFEPKSESRGITEAEAANPDRDADGHGDPAERRNQEEEKRQSPKQGGAGLGEHLDLRG
jgi:hypothetical protein